MIYTYIVYNSILLFSVIFSLIYGGVSGCAKKRISLLFLFLVLWIPASIRYGIGTDYFGYIGIYENAKLGAITTEWGYYLLNFFVFKLDWNEQFIFVISSFLVVYNVILSIDKQFFLSGVLAFICLFYLPSYSLIRQAIAVSFAGIAVSSIFINKDYRFLIFIGLGACFHASVLILYPFYFIRRIQFSPIILIIITLVGSLLLSNSWLLTDFLNSSFLEKTKYGYYASSKFSSEAKIGTGLGVGVKMLLPIFIIILSNKVLKASPKYNIVIWISIAAVIANIASMKIYIFNRLADVFSFLPYILLPILLRCFLRANNRIVFRCIIFIIFVVYFERSIYSNLSTSHSGLGISPYVTIFDR